MNPDIAKLTAGLMLAETTRLDNPAAQYGLVGLIAWMVVRECFGLVKWAIGRKKSNGACGDHDELVRLRAEVENLKSQLRGERRP